MEKIAVRLEGNRHQRDTIISSSLTMPGRWSRRFFPLQAPSQYVIKSDMTYRDRPFNHAQDRAQRWTTIDKGK